MPRDFEDFLERIEVQKGQLLIVPAVLSESTDNPPEFQKERTLYDDGVFFAGLETITCQNNEVQDIYKFFDKVGTPEK